MKEIYILLFLIPIYLYSNEVYFEINNNIESLSKLENKYKSCNKSSNIKPSRGEYETKEEYKNRLNLLNRGCRNYEKYINIVLLLDVSLDYDVDKETFNFNSFPKILPNNFNINYENLVFDNFSKSITRDDFSRTGKAGLKKPYHFTVQTKICGMNIKINPRYFYEAISDSKCLVKYVTSYLNKGTWGYYVDKYESYYKKDFKVDSIAFKVMTPVEIARKIKVIEENLKIKIYGNLNIKNKIFQVKNLELLNLEDDSSLLSI